MARNNNRQEAQVREEGRGRKGRARGARAAAEGAAKEGRPAARGENPTQPVPPGSFLPAACAGGPLLGYLVVGLGGRRSRRRGEASGSRSPRLRRPPSVGGRRARPELVIGSRARGKSRCSSEGPLDSATGELFCCRSTLTSPALQGGREWEDTGEGGRRGGRAARGGEKGQLRARGPCTTTTSASTERGRERRRTIMRSTTSTNQDVEEVEERLQVRRQSVSTPASAREAGEER